MLTRDGWKLVGTMRWEPIDYDVKETCNHCLGRGKSNFSYDDDSNCHNCGGNGFYYTRKERGPQPEVNKHLVQWMRDAYNEWEELYGFANP